MKKVVNRKIERNIFNYTVIFEPVEEGGFIAHVPCLPGCHTQAETLDEAYQMAQDAIYGYIKTLQELKEEIPKEVKNPIITRISVKV